MPYAHCPGLVPLSLGSGLTYVAHKLHIPYHGAGLLKNRKASPSRGDSFAETATGHNFFCFTKGIWTRCIGSPVIISKEQLLEGIEFDSSHWRLHISLIKTNALTMSRGGRSQSLRFDANGKVKYFQSSRHHGWTTLTTLAGPCECVIEAFGKNIKIWINDVLWRDTNHAAMIGAGNGVRFTLNATNENGAMFTDMSY